MRERFGLQVVTVVLVGKEIIGQLHRGNVRELLMDLDGGVSGRPYDLGKPIDQVRCKCRIPVLFDDNLSTSAGSAISGFGCKLTLKQALPDRPELAPYVAYNLQPNVMG